VTTPKQLRDDEGKPAGADTYGGRAQPVPAHQDASGLGPGVQPSYRDDAPQRHRPAQDTDGRVPGTPGTGGRPLPPAGRIRVAGTCTAPMSTTEYQLAVEAVAVLIAQHDAAHAEAA
jgi:hypothetical protein